MSEPIRLGAGFEPGSPEWHEHVDTLIAQELEHGELSWWWLSFADERLPVGSQFLGVTIVEAAGMVTAIVRAGILGLNPGGQVLVFRLKRVPSEEWRYRLLTRAEAEVVV